jgi:hypothetical protein
MKKVGRLITYHYMSSDNFPYHLPPLHAVLRAIPHLCVGIGVFPFAFALTLTFACIEVLARVDLADVGRWCAY